LKQTMVS